MVLLQEKNYRLLRLPQHRCKFSVLIHPFSPVVPPLSCCLADIDRQLFCVFGPVGLRGLVYEFNTVTFLPQGCTKGPHNKEKPPEPVKPDVKTSGEKRELEAQKPKFNEYIISAPKPQEAIHRPRLVSVIAFLF